MKTITKFLFFLILWGSISAQEGENELPDYFVGGSFEFSSRSNSSAFHFINEPNLGVSSNEGKSTRVTVYPYIGRQLSERWSLGLQLQYRFLDRRSLHSSLPPSVPIQHHESQTHGLGAGLFSRYAFFNNSNFTIFCQPFFGYNYFDTKDYRDDLQKWEITESIVEVGVDLGATYQFSTSFRALIRVGGVSYSSGNRNVKDLEDDFQRQNDFNSFNTRLSLSQIGIGVEYWW